MTTSAAATIPPKLRHPEHAELPAIPGGWDSRVYEIGGRQFDMVAHLVHKNSEGQLAVVASGMAKHAQASAIRISQRYAALHAARLAPGQSVTLPDAPYLHLFVPVGAVDLESAGRLETGDAVRFTSTGGQRVTALESAEILLWEMHAGIGAGH